MIRSLSFPILAVTPLTSAAAGPLDPAPLPAEVVASGIPGAGAIMQVGTFQQGSPLRDNPTWIPYTAPGAVLSATTRSSASIRPAPCSRFAGS
jgi:hypothetical protein